MYNNSMASCDTYNSDALKDHQTYIIKINDQDHSIDVKLYKDGEIFIETESHVTKLKYCVRKTAKEILEFTKDAKMELETTRKSL